MAGLLAGGSGGGILQATLNTSPLFVGFLKMVKNATPLTRNAHFGQQKGGGEIEAPRCTRGLKTMAKESLGQKVIIWGPENVGKAITKGARRTARSD